MQMKYFMLGVLSMLMYLSAHGQVAVTRNLNLELAEKDSVTSAKLEASLNAFLSEAQRMAYTEAYVDSTHLTTYNFFFRKLAKIGKHNPQIFHAPTVLKSYSQDGHTYFMTVGFTGVQDSVPFIYQITEFKVVPYEDHYRFYCPFEERTATFYTSTYDDVTYHASSPLNEDRVAEFMKFRDELAGYNPLLKAPLDYYCFASLDELLKTYGFLYSARQCNFLYYDLGFMDNDGKSFMTGMADENYQSGFLGEHLYYSLPDKDKMYWPMAVGLSTYYGGYGLGQDEVPVLKRQFREAMQADPSFNLLEEFKKGRKSSVERHFTHYVICAFICDALMDRGAFDQVMALMYSGSQGEGFFEMLNEIMGIHEGNFHEEINNFVNQS